MNIDPYKCKLKKTKYKKYIYPLIFVFIFDYLLFPFPILAKESPKPLKTINFGQFQAFKSDEAIRANLTSESTELIATDSTTTPPIQNLVKDMNLIKKEDRVVENKPLPIKGPATDSAKGIDHGYHSMTAYTSEVAQTDSSPCTTANGFNVCAHGVEDTIAANFLKFGTKVKIPELFGDRVFVVRDRMNRRHPDRVDVWFKEKPDALKFGIKYARIEVLK